MSALNFEVPSGRNVLRNKDVRNTYFYHLHMALQIHEFEAPLETDFGPLSSNLGSLLSKGQSISKVLFDVIMSTKKSTKYF